MIKFDLKRRTALKGLTAFGVVAALGGCNDGGDSASTPNSAPGSALGAPPPGGSTSSLTIDASVAATGIPASYPIYAYITGLVKTPGLVFYRYDPTAMKPVQMSGADNVIKTSSDYQTGLLNELYTQNYPEPWANYSIPLSRTEATTVADLSSFNSANIPGYGSGAQAFSGRIWISVGKPLIPFIPRTGTPDGPVTGYTTPIVLENGIGGHCFFDWLEFSFDVDGLLYINTTQVDQYGFPISVNATGGEVRNGVQGLYNKKRSEILDKLAAETDPLFNTSVAVPDNANVQNGTYPPFANTQNKLRALAPPSTPAIGTSPYLTQIITDTLAHWKTAPRLEVICPSNALQKTYYGETAADGTTLNFYKEAVGGGVVFSFNDINTKNVLNCSGSLAGNGVAQVGDLLGDMQNTGKAILAGYNRGVIDTTTILLNIDANAGYTPPISQNYTSPTTPYNVWAREFHKFSTNGMAYGFSYDDVGNQQPMLVVVKTSSLTLALGKFE